MFAELWGCPDGYYILQSECYKIFREEKTYPEAEIACIEEGGILANPITFAQSEFLESLIDYDNDEKNQTVWIKPRKEDVNDFSFFFKSNGIFLTDNQQGLDKYDIDASRSHIS